MTHPKYAAFTALDPFFEISLQGLAGLVDGEHYFDTIADDAVFEFRYIFPGWPQRLNGREALMALYAGYGNNIVLHGADALVIHRSRDPRVVIIEYEVHGKIVATGLVRQPIHLCYHNPEQKDHPLERLHGLSGCLDGVEAPSKSKCAN